jgi:hypothetical protein
MAAGSWFWHRALAPFLLVLFIGSAAWHTWQVSTPGLNDRSGHLKFADFLQFYTYGTLVNAGRSDALYDPSAHAAVASTRVDRRLHFTDFHPNYSPVLAWAMAPLARLPFTTAMATWTAISAALYLLAAGLLMKDRTALRAHVRTAWLAIAAWPTIYAVLRYGQISTVSLLFLTCAALLVSRERRLLGGIVFGLLVFKPTLLVVPILVLCVAAEWPLLAGTLIGAAAETALSVWLVGADGFLKYVGVLEELAGHPALVQLQPSESHSVRGFVLLLVPIDWVAAAAGFVALVLAVGAAGAVWRCLKDSRLQWSALTLAALAGSPHLLTYDLVLLAVPLVMLTDWWLENGCRFSLGPWTGTLMTLYAGAWPGTLLARMYRVQISTIGMVLALWLLVRYSRTFDRRATGADSSSSPIMSS